MDRLHAMHVFARIVEVNSFRKAAESLSLPASTITRTIKELETYLGVQLLHRTTRRLSLTTDGHQYYQQCRRILADIETVESGFQTVAGRPKGKLRVDITPSLARLYILPNIDDFQNKYPDIGLTLTLSDRTIDLVQEGIDCVIRAGNPQDSTSLVALQIASFNWIICASPSYLEKQGEPMSLEDLQNHYAVGYLLSRTGRTMGWDFVVEGQHQTVRPLEKLIVNDTDAYVVCGLKGLGLIRASSYMVLPHLQNGSLIRVLAELNGPSVPLSVMYPQSNHPSQVVRAFVDWTKNLMTPLTSHWLKTELSIK
ncbi:LysR substrate-binding domain-containing protein [Pseudomonas fluorescens]|uniref:LysR family transcriptional regulator n=1 Tax=Pseudomonas fluorescens TaxID=294 RepID=UPI003254CBC6